MGYSAEKHCSAITEREKANRVSENRIAILDQRIRDSIAFKGATARTELSSAKIVLKR